MPDLMCTWYRVSQILHIHKSSGELTTCGLIDWHSCGSSSLFHFKEIQVSAWELEIDFFPVVTMQVPSKCSVVSSAVGLKFFALILYLYVAMQISFAPLFAQCADPSTDFSFPFFRSAEQFMTLADVKYNPENLSFTINAAGRAKAGMTCGMVFFTEKVRMTNKKSGLVASFSTSFTFSTRQPEQSTNRSGWLSTTSGLFFSFLSANSILVDPVRMNNAVQNPIDMIREINDSGSAHSCPYCAVEIDTYNNYLDEDPSDNHVGVLLNNLKSNYTYNLCGGQSTSCSFPWTGRAFTAWIDYNGSTKSLEIWFANGSLREGVMKPSGSALIEVPNLDLIDFLADYMYTSLSGCSGQYEDSHEALSWSFASSLMQEMPSPSPVHLLPHSPHLSIRSIIFGSRVTYVILGTFTFILVVHLFSTKMLEEKTSQEQI